MPREAPRTRDFASIGASSFRGVAACNLEGSPPRVSNIPTAAEVNLVDNTKLRARLHSCAESMRTWIHSVLRLYRSDC